MRRDKRKIQEISEQNKRCPKPGCEAFTEPHTKHHDFKDPFNPKSTAHFKCGNCGEEWIVKSKEKEPY